VTAHLAIATLLAACYQPTAVTGAPCAANGDCPGGQRCDLGVSPPICVTMLADGPQGGPLLIDQSANTMVNALALSTTFTQPLIPSDVLVLIGGAGTGIVSVSGGGVSWTQAVASYTNKDIEIWYGVTDGSSPTITITANGMANNMRISVSEWAGLSTTSPLDQVGHASDTTLAPATATVNTVNVRDLVIFAVADAAPTAFGTPAPGTWTGLTDANDSVTDQSAWFEAVSSAGSYIPTVSQTGAKWDAAIAAFRVAP
jgi:hypothetical protein